MSSLKIETEGLIHFMNETWVPYASQIGANGINKRFEVRLDATKFRVVDHGHVVYEGTDRDEAIDIFNMIEA